MWPEVMSIFVRGLWELQFKSALRNFSYILSKYDPPGVNLQTNILGTSSQNPRILGSDIGPIASVGNCTPDCKSNVG